MAFTVSQVTHEFHGAHTSGHFGTARWGVEIGNKQNFGAQKIWCLIGHVRSDPVFDYQISERALKKRLLGMFVGELKPNSVRNVQ